MNSKHFEKIEITTFDNGTMSVRGVHDAEIYSLSYEFVDENIKNLKIEMRSEIGEIFLLKCLNAESVKIDGFNHQNIISEIELYHRRDASNRLEIYQGQSHMYTAEMILELNDKILNGEIYFIHILPSNGCEILVTCTNVALYKAG